MSRASLKSPFVLAGLTLMSAAYACVNATPEKAPPSKSSFAVDCTSLGLTVNDCQVWSTMALPDALPSPKGNRFGDDPNAAMLGYSLFFDLDALSSDDIRCAACHAPERGFAGDIGLPRGVSLVQRNALSLENAARTYPHFWDGRADSLWSQALSTIENDDEMQGNRLAVAHRVEESYRDIYEAAFGPMPDLSDLTRFPAQGRPGSPEWASMTSADQSAVTQVFVNVGKSFEAYVRKIASGPSPVDRYIMGATDAISASAKEGMRLFTQSGCVHCHSGPNLSDGLYHQLDIPLPQDPESEAKVATDRGRAQGREILLASEFNALSPYFDRPADETPHMEEDVSEVPDGLFLTPSLRNVGDTAPYGHNGVFVTLDDVVRFHLAGGGPEAHELTAHQLTDDEVASVVEFLKALHGDTAPRPWSFWPQIGGSGGAGSYDAGAP